MRLLLGVTLAALSSVLVVEACTGFDAAPAPADAGETDAPADTSVPPPPGPMDGGADGPSGPCNTNAPFETPIVAIPGLENLGSVARFSADGQTAYFAFANDAGVNAIYTATRDKGTGSFGAPTELAAVNADMAGETTPWVTADGLSIFYTHGDGTARDVWFATRADAGDDFATPKIVDNVDDPDEQDDYVSVASNRDLWFSSQRDGGRNRIFRALYTGVAYDLPKEIAELNTTTDGTYYALLTTDMLRVYFGRLGPNTSNYDIWTATRAKTTDGFSAPLPVTELNTAEADRPVWISADGCQLYVSRGPNHTMYIASRPAM